MKESDFRKRETDMAMPDAEDSALPASMAGDTAAYTSDLDTPAAPNEESTAGTRSLASRLRGHAPSRRSTPRSPRPRVRVRTFDSFRYRDFRLLWTAMGFIGGGFWVQQLVVGWLVYDLTRSPLLTSLALSLNALPSLVAGPIGGLLADVWDRRRFLAASSAYQAIVTGAFSVVILLGRIEAWHIFAYVLAMGISWAIAGPARVALVSNIVPRHGLVNAFALNSLAFNASRLVAPAVAGLLIVWVGPGPTLLLGVAMHVGAGLASVAIRVSTSDHGGRRFRKPLQQIREGVRYVMNERLVLMLTILSATTMLLLLSFVHGLMPVYASEVYEVGPAGLGLLMSVVGIGSILGTFLVASIGDIHNKGRTIVATLALTIVAVTAFSRIPAISPAILALMVLSGAFTAFFIINSATIQSVVPDELRGRVSSLGEMTIGLLPLGGLLAGGLAELFGAPAATLVAGAALAVVSTGILLRFRGVLTATQR